MSNFNEFCNSLTSAVLASLEAKTGTKWTYKQRSICKINEKKEAVNFWPADDGERNSIMPNIYLDEVYEESIRGRDFTFLVGMIVDIILDTPAKESGIVSGFTTGEMKDRIIPCIINSGRNEEFLSEIPHRRFLDLAVILRAINIDSEGGITSATITNEIAKSWNLSEDDMFEKAAMNAERLLPVRVFAMHGLTVISNEYGVYGAINGLCNTDILKDLSADNEDDDLYIIPSSIHEVFIMPKSRFDLESLKELLKETADNGLVESREILSFSVYMYNAKTGEVSIAE